MFLVGSRSTVLIRPSTADNTPNEETEGAGHISLKWDWRRRWSRRPVCRSSQRPTRAPSPPRSNPPSVKELCLFFGSNGISLFHVSEEKGRVIGGIRGRKIVHASNWHLVILMPDYFTILLTILFLDHSIVFSLISHYPLVWALPLGTKWVLSIVMEKEGIGCKWSTTFFSPWHSSWPPSWAWSSSHEAASSPPDYVHLIDEPWQ